MQDSLLKAFGMLGRIENPIVNPRAYLLRVATNVWIDTLRRREHERDIGEHVLPTAPPLPDTVAAARSAGAVLLHRLPPRERAALMLKEVFDIKVPSPGGTYTVNVGRNTFSKDDTPFASQHAASFRAIYDLADLENSRYVFTTGQSGNPFSSNYSSMALSWSNNRFFQLSQGQSGGD